MIDLVYKHTLRNLIENGSFREGRNGGVYSLFGHQIKHNMSYGFPLLTTKKVHFKSIVVELLWFLSGNTNIKYLHDNGVTIWDKWANEQGDLGPVYGAQWRGFGAHKQYGMSARVPGDGIDQIRDVITSLKNDPYSRRHIVSAWNPLEMPEMALPPCHCLFQFHVSNGKLNCHLYQRSADWFLGVPFNIASYALLNILIARECGYEAGEFIHSFGDYHLYANHIDQANEQLTRQPYDLPLVKIEAHPSESIFDLEPHNIVLVNYNSHPAIKAPVSK